MADIPYSNTYRRMNYSSGIPYSTGVYGQVSGANYNSGIPYSPQGIQQPALGQSGMADSAPASAPAETNKGGFNAGAALQAGGELFGDISSISQLSGIDTRKLIDNSSFAGQNAFDQVGAYNQQQNPFATSTGQDFANIGGSAAKYGATGLSLGGPVGGIIGAIVGLGLGGVKTMIGQGKQEEFAHRQAAAKQRYLAVKAQQQAYREKQDQQLAQTNYTASRYANSFNY